MIYGMSLRQEPKAKKEQPKWQLRKKKLICKLGNYSRLKEQQQRRMSSSKREQLSRSIGAKHQRIKPNKGTDRSLKILTNLTTKETQKITNWDRDEGMIIVRIANHRLGQIQ